MCIRDSMGTAASIQSPKAVLFLIIEDKPVSYTHLEYIQKLRIPQKPKLEIDIQEFKQMENLKYRLDNQLKAIWQAESVELSRLEKELQNITGFFKGKEKREAQAKIDNCKKRIVKMKNQLKQIVKESGYPCLLYTS